jgi:hypothetical protein
MPNSATGWSASSGNAGRSLGCSTSGAWRWTSTAAAARAWPQLLERLADPQCRTGEKRHPAAGIEPHERSQEPDASLLNEVRVFAPGRAIPTRDGADRAEASARSAPPVLSRRLPGRGARPSTSPHSARASGACPTSRSSAATSSPPRWCVPLASASLIAAQLSSSIAAATTWHQRLRRAGAAASGRPQRHGRGSGSWDYPFGGFELPSRSASLRLCQACSPENSAARSGGSRQWPRQRRH